MNEAASELNCSLEEDEARKKAERKLQREEHGTQSLSSQSPAARPLPVLSQAAALWVRPKQAWLTISGRGTCVRTNTDPVSSLWRFVPQARATYACEVLVYESSQTEADKKDIVAADCGLHRISVQKAEKEEVVCVCVSRSKVQPLSQHGVRVNGERIFVFG